MPDPVEQSLRAVLPAVRLVRARHVGRARRRAGGPGEPLPVWAAGELLLPEPDDLPGDGPSKLRQYWRWLVQAELLRTLAAATAADGRKRLASLGPDAAAEVRAVLVADRVVPADAAPAEVWPAFAALALDARAFDPPALARLFPLVAADPAPLDRLAAGVGHTGLVERLQPAGTLESRDREGAADGGQGTRAVSDPSAVPARSRLPGARVDVTADLRRGNTVRAAVRQARAGDPAAADTLRTGLVADLARVLGWDDATAAGWHAGLVPLLATGTGWNRGVRALYELQRVATDLRGDLHTLDPAGWLLSGGRRPLRQPVPHARPVTLLRHLRAAGRHVARASLGDADRDRLTSQFADAEHAAEAAVRRECRLVVHAAATAAGVVPADLPERVALDALVAELLDRVCERGFVRFADLRDAVARNALKLPDHDGPGDWWRGDALLRADRRLGAALPGVYRPAEGYLRAVHRGTAAAFGTRTGRWLCLWLLLPFGGGLMAVEFAKYVALEVSHLRGWVRGLFPADEPALPVGVPDPFGDYLDDYTEEAVEQAHAGLAFGPASLAAAFVLGLLFLALVHSPAARRRAGQGARAVGVGLRYVLVVLPLAVWRSAPVRAVREHPLVRAGWDRLGTAALAASGAAVTLALLGAGWPRLVGWAGGVFAGVGAITNTPPGRRLEEDVTEAVADGWRAVRHNLLPGVVGGVAAAFRAVADRLERGLYAVDEWLRFRDGGSVAGRAARVAVALVWLPLAYLFRFVFYLLVEPQVNPVKHFPVVTVSHKLLLPAVPSIAAATGLPAGTTAAGVSLVPGVFGFVAWELKESWRLYAANRSHGLPAVPVGHHGETVRGLLVPGFHSGTVPKLFRRLRRTASPHRRAAAAAGLHEVEHALQRFVERHLAAYLRGSAAWAGLTPEAGPVRLGVRTATVTLAVPGLGDGLLGVTFTACDAGVTARVDPAPWHVRLTPGQADTLGAAVAGLVRAAGADAGPGVADDWAGWVRFWEGAAG